MSESEEPRRDEEPPTTLEEVLREIEEAEEDTPHDGEACDAISPNRGAQEQAARDE